jgi:hypothetical protein
MASPKLTDIPGIGPSTAKSLTDRGFNTVGSVAVATVETLSTVPGFAPARSATVIAAAQNTAAQFAGNDTSPANSNKKRDKKEKKKDKKKKKRKKKNKDGKRDKKKRKKKDGKKKRKAKS